MISSTVRNVLQFYNQTMENADERVADWPMMQSPWPTLIICLSYVYVVKSLGPNLMKDRKPLDIRWLMCAYNLTMVIVSTYVFYHFGIYGWFGKYNWACQPVDYSYSEDSLGMASTCWWFYLTKFVEFLDTIFFVMRKRYHQVSTLHVVHHGMMPISIWFGLKFTPGGHSTFFAMVNSFVHILMYTYYGLSAFGPHMMKYLWWKKYMTAVQMIQFIMIFTHSFQLMFTDCNYPRAFMWWIGFHAVLFWFLFADFYKSTYLKNAKKGKRNGVCKEQESHVEQNGVHHMDNKITTSNGHAMTNGSRKYANGNSKSNGVVHRNGYVPYTNGIVHCNGVIHANGTIQANGTSKSGKKSE